MSLHDLLGPLPHPVLHLGSTPTTWAEVLGFGTGAINVRLVVWQNRAVQQDGWRDGESIRERMSARFAEELAGRGLPYVAVTGPHEKRLDATDAVLSKGWTAPR